VDPNLRWDDKPGERERETRDVGRRTERKTKIRSKMINTKRLPSTKSRSFLTNVNHGINMDIN
jgi:hypothetical protein